MVFPPENQYRNALWTFRPSGKETHFSSNNFLSLVQASRLFLPVPSTSICSLVSARISLGLLLFRCAHFPSAVHYFDLHSSRLGWLLPNSQCFGSTCKWEIVFWVVCSCGNQLLLQCERRQIIGKIIGYESECAHISRDISLGVFQHREVATIDLILEGPDR